VGNDIFGLRFKNIIPLNSQVYGAQHSPGFCSISSTNPNTNSQCGRAYPTKSRDEVVVAARRESAWD